MTKARELRFAFVFDDYEGALRLFLDVFGLEVQEELTDHGARGVIMRLPTATLELFDVAYGDLVDEVEVGHRLRERVRIAIRVDDLESAGDAVTAAGGTALAEPVVTPWGDRNRRFATSDGLQLTLFHGP